MRWLRSRTAVTLAGMGLALLAGLTIAYVMVSHDKGPREPAPASQGGLIVQTGRDDDIKLDAKRPLRCFVDGRLVGDVTLSECARRNGVASGALDVGLDASGALAAAGGPSTQITPLPPGDAQESGAADRTSAEPPAIASASRNAGCWRYGAGDWSRLPEDMSLGACLNTLYSGICAPGPPAYGRWGDRTLRLMDGRIEVSADNRNFRVLADRNPGCAASPPG